MGDLSKHTLTVNITDRIDWIDKRCSLTDIQKDYIAVQMKDAVLDALTQANDIETKSSGLYLHHVSNNESEAEVVVNCFDCANAFKYDFDGTGCINCTNGSNHKTIN